MYRYFIVAISFLIALGCRAATNSFFSIRVVDDQTGRGVPLAELKTQNSVAWWTDSAGIIAFDEPGLMGQEVFFHVSSPGYEYPKDFFGNRGVKLRPTPGGTAQVKLKRLNIAERLYRVTGAGIYRDSVLAGLSVPLKQPLLNAQVLGQDTVIATPYRGKIYWFWGDTDRASYPLGNFGASGATSELPGRGGLDPAVGIDQTYFTNKDGFSRPMCPDASFGRGLKWIEGVMPIRDEHGEERLLARVAAGTGLETTREWHLALFNDESQIFDSVVRWEIHDSHDSAHPFRARVDGVEYCYLYPNYRVRADVAAFRELKNYEAFTCIAGDGKVRGTETEIDRDASGRARYSWRAGAERLHSGRLRKLIRTGKLDRGESWLQLHDIETGAVLESGRGSVFWNEYRRRWIMIGSGEPGDVWFSEADSPTGPWVYARRVAVHGRYNFYNPTQHPFFDEEKGRFIYFEGTYTASFSGAPAKTPRYDYNQLMYRLDLADPRLALPVPVYHLKKETTSSRYLLREAIDAQQAWEQVDGISFLALPARSHPSGLIPIFADKGQWHTNAPPSASAPLFFALPITEEGSSSNRLHEVLRDEQGRPIGRVWKNSAEKLTFDFQPQPSQQSFK